MMSLLLLALALPATTQAAQNALVTVEQAAIRERPALDAKIIESKAAGTKIRISSFNKDGWYKTKSSTGQFGWVWQGDIAVLSHKEDLKAAGLDLSEREHERRTGRSDPWLFLRGVGMLQGLLSSDISARLGLGAGHWYFALGGAGEIAVQIGEGTRMALRVATYSSSSSVTFQDTAYTVTFEATPVMLGFEHDLSRGESFQFGAALYAGLSMPNRATVKATQAGVPNSTTFEKQYFATLAQICGKYWLDRTFAGVFEVGFYFSRIPKTTATAFNGDGPFRDSPTELSGVIVNQLGPTFGLGLQIAL